MNNYILQNLQIDVRQKILIVDDDPFVLSLLESYIASFGYECLSASSGAEAMELLERDDIDIVITDMLMPNMSGMELLREVRERHPETDVIAVTGYPGTFTYTDVIRAGAIDFMSKPFRENELEAKLKRVIRERMIFRELERLSISDALTGLFNRRQFDIKLAEEAHRAHRQGYDVFLAFLDIDKFKLYNDAFGHQAGDKALQSVGEIMCQCIRKNVDSAFRIGGDEFALIVPQTSQAQVMVVADRLLGRFTELRMDIIGLSIGLAAFFHRAERSLEESMNNMVRRADMALYSAKSSGSIKAVLDDSEL